jgi:hypothetical protein
LSTSQKLSGRNTCAGCENINYIFSLLLKLPESAVVPFSSNLATSLFKIQHKTRGGFILPMVSWPMCHFAYEIGKLIHRQKDTTCSCILPMGQIAYVSFGLRNYRRQTTFCGKQNVHFAYR